MAKSLALTKNHNTVRSAAHQSCAHRTLKNTLGEHTHEIPQALPLRSLRLLLLLLLQLLLVLLLLLALRTLCPCLQRQPLNFAIQLCLLCYLVAPLRALLLS